MWLSLLTCRHVVVGVCLLIIKPVLSSCGWRLFTSLLFIRNSLIQSDWSRQIIFCSDTDH